MNAQVNKNVNPIPLHLTDRLNEAHRELDEYIVQLALGKVEATGKFEKIKEQLRILIGNLRKVLAIRKMENPSA